MKDWGSIEVRGARENNLRDVSLDIPKRRLTVFTGVSGCTTSISPAAVSCVIGVKSLTGW